MPQALVNTPRAADGTVVRMAFPQVSALLAAVQPQAGARYVMFYCADPMEDDGTGFYYESVDMEDAYHPQTILAYDLNDALLPIANGAPIRLRVERQLGYSTRSM